MAIPVESGAVLGQRAAVDGDTQALTRREVVGKGKITAKAVLLMDGAKTQRAICKEAGIDPGHLSRLVKSLRTRGLIESEFDKPKLVFPIPSDFFERLPIENG